MRVAVLGAGAVGGTFAALLDRAGHEVEVTARGENLAAIREHGIRLDGGYGRHAARVRASETLHARPELAILATKAQDALSAIEPNRELLAGVPILVVQNGLGGLRVAHGALPESPLIGGLALIAASFLEPGIVTVTTPLPTVVGPGPGADRALVDRIVAGLSPALDFEVVEDIEAAQWTKLLYNHVNALPAITGLSVQEVIDDPGLRRIMSASMRETSAVAHRAGARFATLQRVSGTMLGLLRLLPLRLVERFPLELKRRIGPVPNPGSTLQSIRRGRRTEIDYLNGAVVRVAREHGLDAPINAALVALVHEVEDTGAFIPPDEVVRRIAL